MAWLHKVTRKKNIDSIPLDTSLHRCLGTVDLALMGIGSMVGSGIYIMTGVAAKELAGPAIVVSFVMATVISFLSSFCLTEITLRVRRTGLNYQIMYITFGEMTAACVGWLKAIGPAIVVSFVLASVIAVLAVLSFTEFASRVPRSGGMYLYMYASIGELAGFVIGWSTLVAIVNGGATNARAWSSYLDSLLNNAISNFTETHIAEWDIGEPIATYPDFMASVIVIILMLISLSGANCSSKFNCLFAGTNCLILLFVIVVGFLYAEPTNWTSPQTKGFMPFGWSGVLAGAGACYWAMTGFEIIGTCTEEAKNPQKSIPLAMGLAIGTVSVLYIGTVAAVTLVCPYTLLDTEAPLPSAFAHQGIEWAKYIVSVGPLLGLTTTLFASIFSFTRIAYAMSEDGLLMPVLGKVSSRTGVPVWSTLIGSSCMAIQACFLDIRHILSFGVVLSLFQVILVSASVIILRYRPSEITKTHNDPGIGDDEGTPVTQRKANTNGKAQNILSGDIPQSPVHNGGGGIGADEDNVILDLIPNQPDTSPLLENDNNSPSRSRTKRKGRTRRSKAKRESTHHMKERIPDEILPGTLKPTFRFLQKYLNFAPGIWVAVSVAVMWVIMVLLGVALIYGRVEFAEHVWWSTGTAIVLFIFLAVLTLGIVIHKQNVANLAMKVPCVPIIPSLSILCSTVLMVATATAISWIGFAIVFILGVVLYFSYGMRHSKLNDGCFELLPMTGVNSSLIDSQDSEDNDSDF